MNRYIKFGLLALAFMVGGVAHANPSDFTTPVQFTASTTNSTATTTSTAGYLPRYITNGGATAGYATTTLTFDTYANQNDFKSDGATLFTIFNASGTQAQLLINVQYSQNNIDWFDDGGVNIAATSSNMTITNPMTWRLSTATSTYANFQAGFRPTVANATTTMSAINVRVPTRYVRAIYSLAFDANSGANGAIWPQWIPYRESSR